MSEQRIRETNEGQEHVHSTKEGDIIHSHVQQTHRVVENPTLAHYEALTRITQFIWLMLGVLEALIGLRIFLRLIAANPESPFAQLIYGITDLFLWPFFGLTVTPSANGMALEIFSIIAMFVYALITWVIVKVIWLIFNRTPVP